MSKKKVEDMKDLATMADTEEFSQLEDGEEGEVVVEEEISDGNPKTAKGKKPKVVAVVGEQTLTEDSAFVILRGCIRGIYALQKLRVSMGNRICAQFREKMGFNHKNSPVLEATEFEKEKAKKDKLSQAKETLEAVAASYKLVTTLAISELEILRRRPIWDKAYGIISSAAELELVRQYLELLRMEKEEFITVEPILDPIPIYQWIRKNCPGCGVAMSAVLLAEIDIHKAATPSSLHKYAGLDVVLTEQEDGSMAGKARGKIKEHLVPKTYQDAEGNIKETEGLTYKPFLKTKILGVLAGCMIKAGSGGTTTTGKAKVVSKYVQVYRGYKFRLQNDPKHKDKSPKHRDNMAKRVMVKRFLTDLHAKWRELEGYEPTVPYEVAKLGMVHHGQQSEQVAVNE